MNCVARFFVCYVVAVFLAVMPVFSAFSGNVSAAQFDALVMQDDSVTGHHGAAAECDTSAKKDCGGHQENLGENCCVSACQIANVQADHDFVMRTVPPTFELVVPSALRTGLPLSIDRPPKQA